jgi:N-acetylneuraminate synthase
MEFSEEQWRGLRDHAREAGLLFLSSPFSREAVEMLDRLGVDAWKVASGEVGNLPLLDHMIELERPILLSSGMSEWTELDAAVARVRAAGRSFAVLQCTTMYPTPPEKTGLNLLGELSRRYECPVGLSDHSGDIFGPLAAVALGASVVEVHVTFSKECFGPDVPASVTLEQLAELVRGARFIETALRNPVDKDRIAEDLAPVRNLFTRSAVLRNPMKAGQVLRLEDLTSKKPGTGIPAHRIPALAGRRLQRDVPNTRPLVEDDLEADPS